MFTGLLHTHRLVVILFLLIYLVKTTLLLMNRLEALSRFTKLLRIPEIVISVLFLLTGGVMLWQLPQVHLYTWIKIVAVIAAIPLAVIGFKRKQKVLAILSFALLVISYGLAEMSRNAPRQAITAAILADPTQAGYDLQAHGKAIYQVYCTSCHGIDGALGAVGAKNLAESKLNLEEVIHIITNGKNAMPKYKKTLAEQEIRAVAAYALQLRK